MQTTLSEEGSSHLTDDGWAETQERVKSIYTQLVDLSVAVDAVPNRVASDFAEFSVVCAVSDLAPNSCVQNVVDLLGIPYGIFCFL